MTATMITTCPACTTVFRVYDEQLAARDGRVRCGQCSTVFDARTALKMEPTDSASQSSGAEADKRPKDKALTFPAIDQVPDTLPLASRTADAGGEKARPARRAELRVAPAAEPGPSSWAMYAAQRETRRTPHRVAWAILGVLLALILMAQMSFHYRAEFVRLFPYARPLFEELCARLNCRVPLPRHAQMVSIESSDLQADPVNPGVMVLTATLRNRASFAQAYPSLELTLTDSRDQPLARRVLGAADYLGPAGIAEAAFKANSELSVKLYVEALSVKATGYRLYLFYP